MCSKLEAANGLCGGLSLVGLTLGDTTLLQALLDLLECFWGAILETMHGSVKLRIFTSMVENPSCSLKTGGGSVPEVFGFYLMRFFHLIHRSETWSGVGGGYTWKTHLCELSCPGTGVTGPNI